ncbi:hypothetical protein [Streptomyces sp. ICC1]|uniref:hypothetical protein n=1 Tax=Streptomyces sp. ICC1 TaxID=2099583 RepID=UPI0013A6BB53|nr:hypothetical protein [Streptomyces sp. ICC1]
MSEGITGGAEDVLGEGRAPAPGLSAPFGASAPSQPASAKARTPATAAVATALPPRSPIR